MSVTDPIADMITRIRNASRVRHDTVLIPASKVKQDLAKILKEEGFITEYETIKDKNHKMLKIQMRYGSNREPLVSGLQRVSKPGLRVYVERDEIPRVYGGMGIAIVSTSKGIMTGQQARRQGVGGEIICYVW